MRDIPARPLGRSSFPRRATFAFSLLLATVSSLACGRSGLRMVGQNSTGSAGSHAAAGSGGTAGAGGHAGVGTAGAGGHAGVGTAGAGGHAGVGTAGAGGTAGIGVGGFGGVGGVGGFGGGAGTPARVPVGLSVTPAALTIPLAGTASLTATLFYSDFTFANVTATASWTSSNQSTAAVRAGQVTPLLAGQATITASAAGFFASSTITIIGSVSLVSLSIDPPFVTLPINGVASFRATGFYSDGSIRDVTPLAKWSTTNPMIVKIDPAGGVFAISPGGATIVAEIGNVAAKASVSVSPATVIQLTLSPPFAAMGVGGRLGFTADATLSDGTHVDVTRIAAWSTDSPMIATIDASGVATGVSAGVIAVKASFGGFAALAKLAVTGAQLKALQLDPLDARAGVGVAIDFHLTGIFSDGTRADLTTQALWGTSAPGIVPIDGAGHAVTRSVGTSIVTATSGGLTAFTTVTVTPASLKSIEIVPGFVTISPGARLRLRAIGTFSDGTRMDVTDIAMWRSDQPMIASVSSAAGSAGVVTAFSSGTAVVTATAQGAQGAIKVFVSPATLQSLVIVPGTTAVPVGAQAVFTAQGTFSDGSVRDVTSEVFWSSLDNGVGSVSNGFGSWGTFTAIGTGSVTITANENDVVAKAFVLVVGASLDAIVVSPADATTTAGLRSSYAATGFYSDGTKADLTAQVTWTTDDAGVATISNVAGAAGQLTARGAGGTSVNATFDGVTGAAKVFVTDASPTALSISPVATSTPLGTGLQFTATLILSNGTQRNVTAQVVWSSSNGRVASISRTGRATALGAGLTTIVATYQGLAATTSLTVADAVPTSVEVSPVEPTLPIGTVSQFTATAILSDGTTRNVTAMATWQSSAPNVAGVNTNRNRGRTTALAVGATTISATYLGLTGSTAVKVTDAVVVELSVSPVGLSLPVGARRQFTAQAIRSDGTSIDVTGQATWTSDAPMVAQVATTGPRGQVTAVSAGASKITATYLGASGTVVVTVTGAAVSSVQVTPFLPTLSVGESVQFVATAVFSDGTSLAVTGTALWTSSDGGVAGISNAGGSRGFATALAKGTTTITATYLGVAGTTTLTATTATIVQIQVTPFQSTLPVGYNRRLVATAIYSDGSNANVTELATWTSTAPGVADVSNAPATKGLVSAFGGGGTTIEAQLAGVAGTATLKVTTAALSALLVEPSGAFIKVGETAQFTAIGLFDDGSRLDLTELVTWTSSNTDVGDISNADGSRGEATGFSRGDSSINAQRGTATGITFLTVQ